MDPKLPSNPTAMLMQAQERKHLVNKLINLKSGVDKKLPRAYNHLGAGRINQRNSEVRKINSENQYMLKKIMGIMHRKPKGNGLEGVPLKKQISSDEFPEDPNQTHDTFQGNADIKLIQSNVDAVNNRFSFEINPSTQQPKTGNPFRQVGSNQSHRKENNSLNQTAGYDTQMLNSPEEHDQVQVKRETYSPQVTNFDALGEHQILAQSDEDLKIVGPTQSQDDYTKVQSSAMFEDNKIPITESDRKLAFHPQNQNEIVAQQVSLAPNSYLNLSTQQIQELNQQEKAFLKATTNSMMIGGKKLYPAQITLNHTVRKQEVKRINRENMMMLNKLRDVKPSVGSCVQQIKHAMKMEEYKRNMSKFRQVGKSQPRPRIRPVNELPPDALPIINHYQSNQSEINGMLREVQPRVLGNRRTSQGQRTYLDAKRQLKIPGSQNQGFRNHRSNFVTQSNNEGASEYQPVTSTARHSRAEDQETDQMTAPDSSNFMIPNPSIHQGVEPNTTSIISADMQTARSTRRPSYLQKLKKSPLLSAINKQQNIPKSIISRVVSTRDEQARANFRKYGQVPRASTSSNVERLFPDRQYHQNSIGSQNSQMSAIARRQFTNNSHLEDTGQEKLSNPINVQIPGKKKMTPAKSRDAIKTRAKKPFADDGTDTHALPSSNDGGSIEIDKNLPFLAQNKQSIPQISEEQSVQAQPIQIEDQQRETATKVIKKGDSEEEDDPYTQYTPCSIDPSMHDPPSIQHAQLDQSQNATIRSETKVKDDRNSIAPLNDVGSSNLDAQTNNEQVTKKASAISLNNVEPVEDSYIMDVDSPVTQTQQVVDIKNRTETSIMGRPASSGSIQEDPIGQESAFKDLTSKKQSIDDEEYSIPQESGYSQEDFEEDNKTKNEAHPIQCMDDQDQIMQEEKSTPMLGKQLSSQINIDKLAATQDLQPQNSNFIQDESVPSEQYSQDQVGDGESDTKTFSQSKIVQNFGVKHKKSAGEFLQSKKQQVARAPTNTQVTRSGLISKDRNENQGGMNTCGTGFYTEKANDNPSEGMIQCKENIILSEFSSKKNID